MELALLSSGFNFRDSLPEIIYSIVLSDIEMLNQSWRYNFHRVGSAGQLSNLEHSILFPRADSITPPE